ncbi:MAG TPA: Ig-like domain repeat protein, partial [Vicinamibacterales bacterium]
TAQVTVTPFVAAATPVRVPLADEFTVGSANIERFFDTVNDPNKQDAVLTPAAFNNRLNKVSLQIRNVMRSPDIIGVEEVENLSTLQAVAAKVNNDATAAGEPNPAYVAYLEEGNDIGGIDSGFLVKTSRVDVVDVTQEGLITDFDFPGIMTTRLNDRPPLILRALVHQNAGDAGLPITVIVNHLRSLSGINDAADGPRVRAKRRAQAEFLANLIQQRQSSNPGERIASVGDYNAFQFNDGYVDSIGTIKGTPAPAGEVTLASSDLVNPDLVDLVDLAPADQRYSFLFDGNAQELDHVLVTSNVAGLSGGLSYGRNNADFAETFRSDPNSPIRLSDHDPVVAYFSFPVTTTTALIAMPPTSTFGEPITFTATVTAGATAATAGTVSFTEGATLLAGPIAVNGTGTASLVTDTLTAGAHTVTARYAGAGALQPSTADVTVVVNSAPTVTSLLSSQNPSGIGQAVTFTATVKRDAAGPEQRVTSGAVEFAIDGSGVGTVNVDGQGQASITTSSLGAGSHTITATFSGANYLASNASVLQHVYPAITIDDVSVHEPDKKSSTTTSAVFTVTLSVPSTDTISVNFSTTNITALAGSDYLPAHDTLVFSPGTTLRTIAITIVAHPRHEATETFAVNLSGAVNAAIADGQGIGSILDFRPQDRRDDEGHGKK